MGIGVQQVAGSADELTGWGVSHIDCDDKTLPPGRTQVQYPTILDTEIQMSKPGQSYDQNDNF